MSGGHFDYKDMRIQDLIDQLERDKYNTFVMRSLLTSMMNVLHAYDWFMSGDTGEKDFLETYNEEIDMMGTMIETEEHHLKNPLEEKK